jgi:hypothetical protein
MYELVHIKPEPRNHLDRAREQTARERSAMPHRPSAYETVLTEDLLAEADRVIQSEKQ